MAFGIRRFVECARHVVCAVVLLAGTEAAFGQLDALRKANPLSAAQKEQMAAWIKEKLAAVEKDRTLEAQEAFVKDIETERRNGENGLEFVKSLAEQLAKIGKEQFAKENLDRMVGGALARALVDTNQIEALPGLIAGLESGSQEVRYLSAVGIVGHMKSFAGDAKVRAEVIAAVKRQGVKESNGYILQHMYRAIGFTTLDPEAFATYLAIFDARLAKRRAGSLVVGVGEIEAFDYFGNPNISGALNQQQKVDLVNRLASFLWMHAQRFGARNVSAEEFVFIGSSLTANETVLKALAGSGGGNIEGVLAPGASASVTQEAIRWVGDAKSQTRGVLNEAPWNVPLAPWSTPEDKP